MSEQFESMSVIELRQKARELGVKLGAGINKQGKWVRYNSNGAMIKGWYTPVGNDEKLYPEQRDNLYYYDLITGAMLKGTHEINGKTYTFDTLTGIMQ